MLESILKALKEPASGTGTRKEVAAAALMVEAARLDRSFDPEERAIIIRLIGEHFKLDQAAATELVAVAEKTQRANYSDWIFIKTINEAFDASEKLALLEMLWKVAYADGSLHKFEKHLIDHVAKELGVSQADLESAQKAAKG